MLDGHGSEMSKRAKEVRNRKKNRRSIFNEDQHKFSKNYPEKFQLKTQSIHQKNYLKRKVERLAEYEQTRKHILFGFGFVIFLVFIIIYIA